MIRIIVGLVLGGLLFSPAGADIIVETFEDEVANATSFSEGGFDFTVSGDLFVENDVGLGAGESDFWLGSGFGDGASAGSLGSVSITSGTFLAISAVLWTGQNDGTNVISGDITFTGMLSGGGTVSETVTISPAGDFPADYVNFSFAGTALGGQSLTGIQFDIDGPGAFDYLLIDDLTLDATAPPTCGVEGLPDCEVDVPEPSGMLLVAAGLLAAGFVGFRKA